MPVDWSARLPVKLYELLKDFEGVEYDMRADLLVDSAAHHEPPPLSRYPRPYSPVHRVPGCESEVYIFTEALPEGGLKFYFGVENPQGISAKALSAILDQGVSGEPLEKVSQLPADIVPYLFGKELSMGKGQGLMGMVAMVRQLALRGIK